jgi:hypothetical protein
MPALDEPAGQAKLSGRLGFVDSIAMIDRE